MSWSNFGPWFSAETVKACALIGLHMMSEENSQKYGLGRPWPRRRFFEHTVDDLAIEVVGQHWTSEATSLSTEDWEVGRVPSSCHLSTDLLCQEMRNVCKGSSESLGFLRSLCSESQRRSLVDLSAAEQSLFLTVDGLWSFHSAQQLAQSKVSLRMAEFQQFSSGTANDWRIRKSTCCSGPVLQLLNGRDPVVTSCKPPVSAWANFGRQN